MRSFWTPKYHRAFVFWLKTAELHYENISKNTIRSISTHYRVFACESGVGKHVRFMFSWVCLFFPLSIMNVYPLLPAVSYHSKKAQLFYAVNLKSHVTRGKKFTSIPRQAGKHASPNLQLHTHMCSYLLFFSFLLLFLCGGLFFLFVYLYFFLNPPVRVTHKFKVKAYANLHNEQTARWDMSQFSPRC